MKRIWIFFIYKLLFCQTFVFEDNGLTETYLSRPTQLDWRVHINFLPKKFKKIGRYLTWYAGNVSSVSFVLMKRCQEWSNWNYSVSSFAISLKLLKSLPRILIFPLYSFLLNVFLPNWTISLRFSSTWRRFCFILKHFLSTSWQNSFQRGACKIGHIFKLIDF